MGQNTEALGHICLRSWESVASCQKLFRLVGTSSMAFRTYPAVESVLSAIHEQAARKLRVSGMSNEIVDEIASALLQAARPAFIDYWTKLPKQTLLQNIKEALVPIRKSGLIFVRLDRNPGRVVLLCPILWMSLQRSTFLQCPRYCAVNDSPSSKDPTYSQSTIAVFINFVLVKCGQRIKDRAPSNARRPTGYFTIKQKSLLLQSPPIIKIRPIISHFFHPCRCILRRVARALSILVALATQVVRDSRQGHVPIWRMHQGTRQWLESLARSGPHVELVEFDVEDCFLNTPRHLVVPALRFWTEFEFGRRRRIHHFSISKDSKAEDHVGRPCSAHFWELSAEFVLAVVEWELEHNSLFEVLNDNGEILVLRQHKGLPIGGHLSASLVELVALHREFTQPRPSELLPALTARYRDNYFAAVSNTTDCSLESTAKSLSKLLCMPVKPVGRASKARFLETQIAFDGNKTRCVLAFRTDPDRQGESKDVTSWPTCFDPRARMLIPGLVMGLVSKLRFYSASGVAGYTATIRKMYQFMKSLSYPKRWWLRPLAVALVRVGAPIVCLPPLLRFAVSWPADRGRKQIGGTN